MNMIATTPRAAGRQTTLLAIAVALAGAEKILRREIDASAHDDILGELARDL